MSAEYVDELAGLQADVPEMSEAEVVAMMERELAVPWEDVFSDIDPEPLAAGTIAQVHRARMTDGHRVVVKVQRPEAEEVISNDLALLDMIVGRASRSRRLQRVIDLPSLAEQVSRSLRDELDFGEEARNIVRMGEIVEAYGRIAVPSCHRELSTRRLLVMDEVVGGVPLLEAPPGPERTEAARQLMQTYYKQVLEEGFFHADPHPGNMLWADGKIWLLDLGMVGRIDAETRRQLFLVLLAFAQGDVDLLADVSLDLSGTADVSDVDVQDYREDIAAVVTEIRGRPLHEINLVDLLNQLTAISVRHGVPLPPAFVMVGKALAQVDGTVSELAPELDPIAEARALLPAQHHPAPGRATRPAADHLRGRAAALPREPDLRRPGHGGRQPPGPPARGQVHLGAARAEGGPRQPRRRPRPRGRAHLDRGDAGEHLGPHRSAAHAHPDGRRGWAVGLVRRRGRADALTAPVSAGSGVPLDLHLAVVDGRPGAGRVAGVHGLEHRGRVAHVLLGIEEADEHGR